MTYSAPLPNTGVILPVAGSGQAWEVAVFNANFTGVESAFTADRARISTVEGKVANNGVVPAGSSASRDGFYGIPASAAARVALANSGARWFNTDTTKGYQERYFSAAADAGAIPTLSAKVAGWYPDGPRTDMPYVELNFPSTTINWVETPLGAYTEVSDIWGWHESVTNPTRITPTIAGVYEVLLQASIATSGGFIRMLKNGATYANGGATTGAGLGGGPTSGRYENVVMNGTTDFVTVNMYGANQTVACSAQVIMRYLGPDRSA